MLFDNEPLPRIKRAESALIPEVVDLILSICHEAARSHTRHVVLLTGVPGSGKTLVGLQVAHHRGLEDLRAPRQGRNNGAPAVFLSGNGPLVQVLQDALGSTVFVAGMKKFVEYYLFKRATAQPSTHVIVFDEAQRAWDAEHMATKHEHAISEPAALLRIGERIPEWTVLLALIGEGQEIHKGEEAGLAGWVDALRTTQHVRWTVHAPLHVAADFPANGWQVVTNPLLNLSTTLRSHVAADVQPEKPTISWEQINLMLDNLQHPRDKCLFGIGVFCALRTNEVFGLRWGSYQGDSFMICDTAWRGTLSRNQVKTEASRAPVPIPEELQALITQWREVCPDTSPDALMFPTRGTRRNKGKTVPFTAGCFMERHIQPIAKKLGIPPALVTFRVLRRTAATDLQKFGDVKEYQGFLRHSNPSTALVHYVQTIPGSVREAANARAHAVRTKPPNASGLHHIKERGCWLPGCCWS
jgi:integrase